MQCNRIDHSAGAVLSNRRAPKHGEGRSARRAMALGPQPRHGCAPAHHLPLLLPPGRGAQGAVSRSHRVLRHAAPYGHHRLRVRARNSPMRGRARTQRARNMRMHPVAHPCGLVPPNCVRGNAIRTRGRCCVSAPSALTARVARAGACSAVYQVGYVFPVMVAYFLNHFEFPFFEKYRIQVRGFALRPRPPHTPAARVYGAPAAAAQQQRCALSAFRRTTVSLSRTH
jgi:hypothetical protein